jgi:hypothetical protein
MTPAPKRRWFAFSLRTLFVVVTVVAIAAYAMTVLSIVRQRQQASRVFPIRATYANAGDAKRPPFVWRMLGAETVHVVVLEPAGTESDVEKLRRLFPEASVAILKP